jgi:hypothetical protein
MNYLALIFMTLMMSCSEAELIGGGSAGSKSEGPSQFETGSNEQVPGRERVFGDGLPGDEDKILTYEEQLVRGEGFNQKNTECAGTNIVKNSNFELGYSDFTTEYTWQTIPFQGYMPGPERRVNINSDPNANHRGYTNHADDDGKMLVINLAATPLVKFWCQNLNVIKDKLYQISVRSRKAVGFDNTRDSLSEWVLDDATFTQQIDPTGDWGKFLKTWVADSDKTIELCGRNIAAAAETADLIIDDIKFIRCD